MTHADRLDAHAAVARGWGDKDQAAACEAGAAALREVAELRAKLNDERARNDRLHDDLLALTRPHLLTCPWCHEDRSSNTASAQIMHLVQCGDKRHAQSANEIAALRARMGDTRRLASCIEEDAAPDELDYAAAKRLLAHPAPAPASMFLTCACHGHMKGNVKHGPFNCIGQTPAQATCPECGRPEPCVSACRVRP